MPLPPRPEAVNRLLAVLRALLFAKEEPKGSNAGQAVEAFQAVTGNQPPDPWCASLIAFAGVAAFEKDWPLPRTASCQALYERAATYRFPVRLVKAEEAEPGDLMLVWFPALNRYAHIACLTSKLEDGKVATIEGNTTDDGSREGWRTMQRTRVPKPKDAFVRWCP